MSPMWTINFHLEVDKIILIEILSVATITLKKSFFCQNDTEKFMSPYKRALIFILKTP